MGRDHNLQMDSLIHYGTPSSVPNLSIHKPTILPGDRGYEHHDIAVQQVKTNKDDAVRLTTTAFAIIYALINICHDTKAKLPPNMVRAVGKFFNTLQRILTYLRNHLGSNVVKRVIHHFEDSTLIAKCNAGLEHTQSIFGIQMALITNSSLAKAELDAAARHQELTEVMSKWSVYGSSAQTDSWGLSLSTLSLLPAPPQIFHGRENKLCTIVHDLLHKPRAHIAILGPGGIGKSSLALAVLHVDQIFHVFPDQYFIPCDSAHSVTDLVGLLTSHFSIEGKPTKAVLKHLTRLAGPVLLILDNTEMCWEPLHSRGEVEDFLSHLADIKHLGLIVTMRGAERPSGVQWTRPFLPVFPTLSPSAAREVFMDIADDSVERDDKVDNILALTDHLPLATSLVASLVAIEGWDSVIKCWKAEGTSILSDGANRRSNLNTSIAISLSSPRFTSNAEAKDLLALLAMLPDSISIMTLDQITESFPQMSRCMTTLRRTALVVTSDNGRHITTLVPIGEYMCTHSAPPTILLEKMYNHFYVLLDIFSDVDQPPPGGSFRPIISNLGNIRSILQYFALQPGPHVKGVARAIIQASNFTYYCTSL
ncbi:hypothetical protein DFH07DRAFT_966971 [Mycena maculata]|uniref:Novel STAND NTPase 1 domain-containing protein n=1 Tax=Mycena maculata TaxID=230809 RepID=A0AAD7I7T8_9AGAR|nr:hypothetical protein DFH07DRAFT_966971 [Mycena maculata]